MLFEVTRTSSRGVKTKPHNSCIPIRIHVQTNTTICKRIYKNISDDGFVNSWGIEINSIEDLMKFENKVKQEKNEDGDSPELILTRSSADYGMPCIEIYDDYRE